MASYGLRPMGFSIRVTIRASGEGTPSSSSAETDGRSLSDSEASELPQRRCTGNASVNTCRSCGRSSSILGVLGDHPGPNRVATQRSPNLEAASLLVTWLRTSLHLSNSTPRTMQTDEVNSLYRRACIDRTSQQSRTKSASSTYPDRWALTT